MTLLPSLSLTSLRRVSTLPHQSPSLLILARKQTAHRLGNRRVPRPIDGSARRRLSVSKSTKRFPDLETPPPTDPANLDAPSQQGRTEARTPAIPAALPPVRALPPPSGAVEPAPLDIEVERVQTKAGAITPSPSNGTAGEHNPLPPAAEGAARPAAPTAASEDDAKFLHDPDRLPLGPQSMGLSIQVISPPALNINKPASLKIVVKNTGAHEALGVVVRDVLPPGLTYEGSQPEARRLESILTWSLGPVPAGAERTIVVNVIPTQVGSFDHAATVSMMAGGRATTMVREPKLKVEQTSTSGKVLKGQPVQFRIAVSNPGDGPVRNVTVQAKLSAGLHHESSEPNDQNLFEQTIDVINPGERLELDTLVADTTIGGEQSCVVVVQSPDVVKGGPDAKSVKTVTIIEPKLSLTISGADKRYTETPATYDITLKNAGTAPAKNLKVQAVLPMGTRPMKTPPGASWNSQTRRLVWSRSQLGAGEDATLSFQVRLGGIGLYTFAADARAEGGLFEKGTTTTDVQGLADVQVEVSESRRVVDVGDDTIFKIVLTNKGSKEATKLGVSAKLSDTIEPEKIAGVEDSGKFAKQPDGYLCVYPLIDRLAPGTPRTLEIQVKATKAGIGSCHVYVTHSDPDAEKLEDHAAVKVTQPRQLTQQRRRPIDRQRDARGCLRIAPESRGSAMTRRRPPRSKVARRHSS